MRRTPQQERGQRRVQQILDAAAEVFSEVGYEVATTNMIAHRANTSIGSLYQFFPNKDSIIKTLAQQLAEQLDEKLTPPTPGCERRNAIGNFVDEVYRFSQEHAGFLSLFHGSFQEVGSARAYPHINEKLQQYLQTLMAGENAPPTDPMYPISIRIAVCCTAAVLSHVSTLTPENREIALAETKRMLVNFLCSPGRI